MIVLGIDPGTAALGYGIVERSGGKLRAVDHGVVVTSPDLPLGERLLAIHAGVAELIALPIKVMGLDAAPVRAMLRGSRESSVASRENGPPIGGPFLCSWASINGGPAR